MTQIFIFGASIVHGVGAEDAGWADLIKRKIHNKMYSENGTGEKYEVYNFGNPGATIGFVLKTFQYQIQNYHKEGKKIVILSVGMNNAKAKETPDNYVSTIDEYKAQMSDLLQKIKSDVDQVICVGLTPVDEKKTMPMRPGGSYFENGRVHEFNKAFADTADENSISFVNIEVDLEDWCNNYLYDDGLHPNQKGHQLILERVFPQLEPLL
jgi:acyl-CoA thioesterase-1